MSNETITEPAKVENTVAVETEKTDIPTTPTAASEKTTTEEIAAPIQSSKPDVDAQKTAENPMRQIAIDKVVINIGVGEAGDKLIKAEKVIDLVLHRKSIQTLSRTTNRDFGIRKKMPIGCKVTLRGEPAEKFLVEALWVKDNRIPGYSFDQEGNFSFGIPDYTEFRNMKYDPEIGIFGMDISVTMKRPGKRISTRRIKRSKIPKKVRITPSEVKEFVKNKFNLEVIE